MIKTQKIKKSSRRGLKKNSGVTRVPKEEVLQFGQNKYVFSVGRKKIMQLVSLPKGIYAILHGKDLLEVVYAPQEKSVNFLKRKFTFTYQQKKFDMYFEKPSDFFKNIFIKKYQGLKKEGDFEYDFFYTNLLKFRDYYSLKKITDVRIKKYFSNKTPINFFVKGNFKGNFDFRDFAQNLNFFMHYYDRRTPLLMTYNEGDSSKSDFLIPCYSDNINFPKAIDSGNINSILLDILSVALSTPNPVLRYLFYYQVLEYVSFYYMKEETKNNLNKILKDPNVDKRVNNILKIVTEESREYINKSEDSQRLEQTIKNLCDYKDIQNEIEKNKDYFMKSINFDGGFSLGPLLNKDQNIKNPSPEIMVSIKNNIVKIRNVLVHLRESRENKIILPTKKNHVLIQPYLFLIQRIAEQLAIHFE